MTPEPSSSPTQQLIIPSPGPATWDVITQWVAIGLLTTGTITFIVFVIENIFSADKKREIKPFYLWIAAIAFFGGLLSFFLPIAINSGFNKDDDGSRLRQALLYTTGGLLGVITLGETHRKNDQEKEKNEQEKEKNDQEHTRQVHAERRSRYAKAIEQLANDKAAIRLGGIYTLVGLVDEWLTDTKTLPDKEKRKEEGQVIINNLCAYIRSPFSLAEEQEYFDQENIEYNNSSIFRDPQLREEQEVRRTIFTEMSKRLKKSDSSNKSKSSKEEFELWSQFSFDFNKAPIFYQLSTLAYETLSFEGAIFYITPELQRTLFRAPVIFRSAHFARGADFSEATFTYNADFSGATFMQETKFVEVSFKQGANFSNTTFTQEANFSYTAFTEEANFSNTLFTQDAYIFWANFRGKANFNNAHFLQIAHFDNSDFNGNSTFIETLFSGSTSFNKTTFSGVTEFRKTDFRKNVNFSKAKFKGKSRFPLTQFLGKSDFSNTSFTRSVNFLKATFAGETKFINTRFTQSAYFLKATFTGGADFSSAYFTQSAYFLKATFIGNSDLQQKICFIKTIFRGNVYFNNVIFAKSSPIFMSIQEDSGKICGAQFAAIPKGLKAHNFAVHEDSRPILLGEAELYNIKYKIPVGAVLFDPDSWDEEKQEYTRVSEPAKPLDKSNDSKEEKPTE